MFAAILLVAQWLPTPSVKATPEIPIHIPPPAIVMLQPIKPLDLKPIEPLALADFPIAAEGTYSNTYAPGNCTWYVASMKQIPDSWGNANTWAERAAADGVTVSAEPITGAIATTTRGWLGHVAVVRAVQGDQVLIDEMNVVGLGQTDQGWQAASDFVYIYK